VALSAPAVGDRVRCREQIGDGEHALDAGSAFTVAEVAEPGVAGVQTSSEPVVILIHAYEGQVPAETGWTTAPHARRIGVPLSRFHADFEDIS
jgi:hypothetical protein